MTQVINVDGCTAVEPQNGARISSVPSGSGNGRGAVVARISCPGGPTVEAVIEAQGGGSVSP